MNTQIHILSFITAVMILLQVQMVLLCGVSQCTVYENKLSFGSICICLWRFIFYGEYCYNTLRQQSVQQQQSSTATTTTSVAAMTTTNTYTANATHNY